MTFRSLGLAGLCLALPLMTALPAFAEVPDHGDSQTIRSGDLPADPPRFEGYPARDIFRGRPAAPDVRTQARSRAFRTMIRSGVAEEGVNFAGHYSIVSWGCGTGCRGLAVVDVRNGKVHHPANLRAIDNDNVDYDDFLNQAGEWELLRFRPDSRLLVVIGGINEDSARRGISYFVWEGGRMKRIRFVHKPYEAGPAS